MIVYQKSGILYLITASAGSVYDRTLADEVGHLFPDHTVLVEDLGYLGCGPENITVLRPKKKLKKSELTRQDKEENRQISQIRVPVEQIMVGVKRFNIVKEKMRIRFGNVRDQVMLIASGLYNLRTAYRNN